MFLYYLSAITKDWPTDLEWRIFYMLYLVRRLVHSSIVTTSASILQNVKLLPFYKTPYTCGGRHTLSK